jgi:hypothetical protein
MSFSQFVAKKEKSVQLTLSANSEFPLNRGTRYGVGTWRGPAPFLAVKSVRHLSSSFSSVIVFLSSVTAPEIPSADQSSDAMSECPNPQWPVSRPYCLRFRPVY